mgnify:CR=1 FL=1
MEYQACSDPPEGNSGLNRLKYARSNYHAKMQSKYQALVPGDGGTEFTHCCALGLCLRGRLGMGESGEGDKPDDAGSSDRFHGLVGCC